MRRTQFLFLIFCLTLGGVGVWFFQHFNTVSPADQAENGYAEPGFNASTKRASVDDEALQLLANSSCECARKNPKANDSCWTEYNSAIEGFVVSSAATACAPISTEMDCIATDQGDICVTTGYNVNAASRDISPRTVCRPEQARAIENAFYDAPEGSGLEAVNKTLRRINAGELTEGPEDDNEGCV